MDAEFDLQPGDELFLFDRQAEVSLIDTPDGVILSIDGPDGEWSATIHGPSGAVVTQFAATTFNRNRS